MIGDNFNKNHVFEMFTIEHFVIIFIYLILAVFFAIKTSKNNTLIIRFIIFLAAVYVVLTEIIKIASKFFKGNTFIDMVPMPFCSLFIPGIICSLFKNKHLRRTGYTFMGLGGIVGGFAYIFIPNGSVGSYPIYHLNFIHGVSYHFVMLYIGLLILISKIYIPKLSDFKYYFSFMSLFTIIGIIVHHYYGGNWLFLFNPVGINILDAILAYNNILYLLIVYIGESVVFFFGCYLLYNLIKKIIKMKIASMQEA